MYIDILNSQLHCYNHYIIVLKTLINYLLLGPSIALAIRPSKKYGYKINFRGFVGLAFFTYYIVTHNGFDCGFQLSYSHCTSYTTTV